MVVPLAVIEAFRDRLIEEGVAEVTSVYEEGSPKRDGAVAGFELCRGLRSQRDFERVLRARRKRELRMVAGFHRRIVETVEEKELEGTVFSNPIVTTDDGYWKHRYATLQVEFVYYRLLVLWALEIEDA